MKELTQGMKAPSFKAVDHAGLEHTLEDYSGRRLVLYFYPKDSTPGCTVQAKNLSHHMNELNEAGYAILGVSADSAKRHCNFIEKQGISFPLLVDEDKTIIQAYGVWGEKKFMGKTYQGIKRTTFLIDEEGHIERVIDKVKTKAHAEQILQG